MFHRAPNCFSRRSVTTRSLAVMTDLLTSVSDVHGLFLRRDALAVGYDDRALIRALRAKQIHRVRHGTYVLAHRWMALDEVGRHVLRARGVMRTARTEVALSHVSALAVLGAPLWNLPLDEVHLTRRDGRSGRREAGVAQHSGELGPTDIIEVDGLPITCPTRSALDLTMMADVEHAVPVIDHLLHVGAVDRCELQRESRRRDTWPSTLSTELAVRLADGRRESVGESRSGLLLWRGGLPCPQPQYDVLDPSGHFVGRVDFAWPELGVFLEFDGKEKYSKHRRPGESVLDAVLREKRREERICRLTGWRCIRITWADLENPERTIAMIRSVLAGGPVH